MEFLFNLLQRYFKEFFFAKFLLKFKKLSWKSYRSKISQN